MGKYHAKKAGTWLGHVSIGIMLLAHLSEAAVESTTETFMAMAKVIQGGNGTDVRATFFSLPIVSPVTAAGTITAAGGTTMEDANAAWTAGQFEASNGTFYVEFNNGLMADIAACDYGNRRLTLPDPLPTDVVAGDAYRIRKHLTLASIFGANNESGLKGGPNPNQADKVMLIIPPNNETHNYFFADVAGFRGWYEDNYTPADQQIVYPEQGLAVFRKTIGNVVLFINGPIRDCATLAPITPGYNLVGTFKCLNALTLSELGLYTGDPGTGLAAGTDPNTADNVLLITPDSLTKSYFYVDAPGLPEGWYDWTYQLANDVTIEPGSAFFINRKAPRPSFNWQIPTE